MPQNAPRQAQGHHGILVKRVMEGFQNEYIKSLTRTHANMTAASKPQWKSVHELLARPGPHPAPAGFLFYLACSPPTRFALSETCCKKHYTTNSKREEL